MPEICTPPLYGVDKKGNDTVTFASKHTWADVVRWIAANPSDVEEVLRLLEEYKDA